MTSTVKLASVFICLVLLFSCAHAAVPEYTGTAVCVINNDSPDIDEFYTGEAYIEYKSLDKWLRAYRVVACLGPETMSDNHRYSMQNIELPGWQRDTYDFIPGLSLYQRCHLVGNQLGGAEIAENLVTGTQYLNIVGMLPIENMVADYIRTTGNHVLYSAWPYYGTGNYVCYGVQLEAKSVEDDSIRINRYCFNVQPGISIDYRTGLNKLADISVVLDYTEKQTKSNTVMSSELTYILNTNTKRFHDPSCPSCTEMKPSNRQETTLTRDELIESGYKPCGRCQP